MGERVYVRLSIPSTLATQAEVLPEFELGEEQEEFDGLTTYCYEEVNYGNLQFLDALREAGIAYDSSWDAGHEFGAGTQSCRFTPEGDVISKELYDDEYSPDMHELMKLIDDPVALRQLILDHQEKRSVLEWDGQEEYGKVYQAKQLLLPNPS